MSLPTAGRGTAASRGPRRCPPSCSSAISGSTRTRPRRERRSRWSGRTAAGSTTVSASFDGEVEACINGRTVALGAYFGEDVDGIVRRLLDDQLRDGGWNCWTEYGSTRSSFDSTINVLEGLLAHEQATGGTPQATAARRRGEEYLLERSLFRRRSTGEVVSPSYLTFSFPPRWRYDVLRALDYFQVAGGTPDERLDEAVELVRAKQQPDGTWLLEDTHPGAVHFPLEDGDGSPSRWNTLRALRVLRWHGGSPDGPGVAGLIRPPPSVT